MTDLSAIYDEFVANYERAWRKQALQSARSLMYAYAEVTAAIRSDAVVDAVQEGFRRRQNTVYLWVQDMLHVEYVDPTSSANGAGWNGHSGVNFVRTSRGLPPLFRDEPKTPAYQSLLEDIRRAES